MDKIVGMVMGEFIDTIEFTLKGILMREITKLVFNVLALITLSFVIKYTRTMIAKRVDGCVTGINQNRKTKKDLAQDTLIS
jgi:uncharacterized PurR-regulated membrane protein YhhQ (DUF165 family)